MKYGLILLIFTIAGCSSGRYLFKEYGGPKTKHQFTEGEERNYKITLTSAAGRNDSVKTKIFFKMNLNVKVTKVLYNRYETIWTYSGFKISGFPSWVQDLVTDTQPWVFDVTIREKDSLLFYRQSPNGFDVLFPSLHEFVSNYRKQMLSETRFFYFVAQYYDYLSSVLIEENKQLFSLTNFNGLPLGDSVKNITQEKIFDKYAYSAYDIKYALPRDSNSSLYHIYSYYAADSTEVRLAFYRYLRDLSSDYGLQDPELVDVPITRYTNDATYTYYKSGWLKMKKTLRTIHSGSYFDTFEVMVYEAGS